MGRGDSSSSRHRSLRGVEQERKRERGQGVCAISADKRHNISFGSEDFEGISIPHSNPLVISMDVARYVVRRVLVHSGGAANVLFLPAFEQLGLKCSMLKPIRKLLQGHGGAMIKPLGSITLQTTLGQGDKRRAESIEYLVVDAPFPYNVILGLQALNQFEAVISTFHLKVKFPTPTGVGEVRGIQKQARSYRPEISDKRHNISFGSEDFEGISIPHSNPLVISIDMARYVVRRVLVHSGGAINVLFLSAFEQLGLKCSMLKPIRKVLQGHGGAMIKPLGLITLQTTLGQGDKRRTESIEYLVVDAPYPYNVILGHPALNQFEAVISTFHLKVKFPTPTGVGEVRGIQKQARSYRPEIRAAMGQMSLEERLAQKQAEFEARRKGYSDVPPRKRSRTNGETIAIDVEDEADLDMEILLLTYDEVNDEVFGASEAPPPPPPPPCPQPAHQPSLLHNCPPGIGVSLTRGVCLEKDMDSHNNCSTMTLYEAYCNASMQAVQLHNAIFNKTVALEAQNQASASQYVELHDKFSRLQLDYQELSQRMVKLEEAYRAQTRPDKDVVRNFKKSARGKSWVEERGAEYLSVGFSRCQLQFENSGLFPTDTPLNFLDMSLRMEGEPDVEPIEDNDNEDDEAEA